MNKLRKFLHDLELEGEAEIEFNLWHVIILFLLICLVIYVITLS